MLLCAIFHSYKVAPFAAYLILAQKIMPRRRRQQDIEGSSEEAKEEMQRVDDQSQRQESQGEGQDLMENVEQDEREIEALDHYEREGIDDQEYEPDMEARRRADEELERRDQKEKRGQGDEMEEYLDDDEIEKKMNERRRILYAEEQEEQIDERRYLDAEDVKGKLSEWIKEDETVKYIKSKFGRFLVQFKGDGEFPIYGGKIHDMCISNKQSIEISYSHLKDALPTIAMWVGLEPQLIMPQLNATAYYIACRNYSSYKDISPEVFVKIRDLPLADHIRDLRFYHLGRLIKGTFLASLVKGVVTTRSEVFNQLKKIFYRCSKCGYPKGPFYLNQKSDSKLGPCTSCQSSGPFPIDRLKTLYRNYQKATIQELPSQVMPGRIPRSKDIIVMGDNIDVARPGDEIQVTGAYVNKYDGYANYKYSFPLFNPYIEVNYIQLTMNIGSADTEAYNEQNFIKFSKQKNLAEKIYGSIAPSIYGYENIKRSLTLTMFGGVPNTTGQHHVRGDINLLLLGDPGTAKSQFLKSIQKVFHRCVYTTGKGASAVGLTASVRKDFQTGQWKLEAGALVMADKGICLIDQFDKMNEHDRTSIHQAMQQQSISISKAGIVTSLRARCSIIAAANPVKGFYDSKISFMDNVDLTDPILSRFDILNVVKDQVSQEIDHDLSTFVINSHIESHPYNDKYNVENNKMPEEKDTRPYVEYEFLKQYIKYAREKCRPELPDKNRQIILNFYKELRQESQQTHGLKIMVRHLESLIRIATAHAKMHLKNEVTKEDIDVAIQVILRSFIETQKHGVANQIRKKFKKYMY